MHLLFDRDDVHFMVCSVAIELLIFFIMTLRMNMWIDVFYAFIVMIEIDLVVLIQAFFKIYVS